MPTLKASSSGLKKVQQAREENGRNKDDERWLLEASKIVEPDKEWLPAKKFYANGCSQSTWNRFLLGHSVNTNSFKAFCQVLNLNWEEIVDRPYGDGDNGKIVDWDSCPEVTVFYDRTSELAKLTELIQQENCRLVAILGMGGIGKTTLAIQLGEQLQTEFEIIIWRSIQYAPTALELLANLIPLVTNFEADSAFTKTLGQGIGQFMAGLRSRRCLIILDGLEALFGSNQLAGTYRPDYEEYGKLFREIGSSTHQSCLVLTSHEQPREIATLAGNNRPVRCVRISGLQPNAARQLLTEQGLVEEPEWEQLIQRYRGNPLALKIVSDTILELFNGKVSEFIQQNTIFVGQVSEVLDRQFERLSDVEKKVLYRIATGEAPMSISQISEKISPTVSISQIMEVLESLARRSLIEKTTKDLTVLFMLQPVVMKYIVNRFKHVFE